MVVWRDTKKKKGTKYGRVANTKLSLVLSVIYFGFRECSPHKNEIKIGVIKNQQSIFRFSICYGRTVYTYSIL